MKMSTALLIIPARCCSVRRASAPKSELRYAPSGNSENIRFAVALLCGELSYYPNYVFRGKIAGDG